MAMPGVDYNAIAQDYAHNRSAHPVLLARLIDAVLRWSAPRVLEIGCGTGNYIGRIQTATGCTAFGVDPSVAMLGVAHARWPEVGVEEARGEALPYGDGAMDIAYCVDVVHHLQDAPAMVRETRRVLVSGGLLAIATDSERIIATRCPLAVYWPETVALEMRRYHPIDQLRKWLLSAGFVDIREETVEYTYSLESLDPYRNRAYSALLLLPDEVFARGLAKLEADLAAGPVFCNARYTLLWAQTPLAG